MRYLICSGLSDGNCGYFSERIQSASSRSANCFFVRAAFWAGLRALNVSSLSMAICSGVAEAIWAALSLVAICSNCSLESWAICWLVSSGAMRLSIALDKPANWSCESEPALLARAAFCSSVS